jgi:hypothetical protein
MYVKKLVPNYTLTITIAGKKNQVIPIEINNTVN